MQLAISAVPATDASPALQPLEPPVPAPAPGAEALLRHKQVALGCGAMAIGSATSGSVSWMAGSSAHHVPAAVDRIAVRSHSGDNVATMERRSDYGFDAPYALVAFAALGAASAVAAIAALWSHQSGHFAVTMGLYSAFFLGNALSFLYTTRRGKFQVWHEVLDELHLRGDERVLDMGCGRGAVLTAVASRLRTGRATGIDLWSTHDQSGNSRDVTMRNASLEGVQDRIDIETGDMRALPFPDATFDVVVSSLAIHNIRSNAARAQAIGEAWRVLKPGGRLAIADIRATARYVETLRRLGATAIARRGLGWRFWYGNPLAGTSLVTASKRECT